MCGNRNKGKENTEFEGCGCGHGGRLQKYKDELEKEILAVKEAIHELKGQ